METVKFGQILLPKDIDVSTWGVVACDQYTSQPEYWENLRKQIKKPSTLDLILPECYLDETDRIGKINQKMEEYQKADMFDEYDGTVLVKRTTESGTRYGIMALVNLDDYSNNPSDKALIRGTEGIVAERIPPRVKIRENATMELPHVMVLIDDKDRTVIEPLIGKGKKVYSGKLSGNGGFIEGYNITDVEQTERALQTLLDNSDKKYGEKLLCLVGDGNHSLATAKACNKGGLSSYALVELVNIYDEGLIFKPIHRVVFGVNNEDFASKLEKKLQGDGSITLIVNGERKTVKAPNDGIECVRDVQAFIDQYVKENGGKVDYIHGDDNLKKVAKDKNGVGIFLNAIDKESFFPYIVNNGPMPRKTFSMGEADEKRYYVEARRIK